MSDPSNPSKDGKPVSKTEQQDEIHTQPLVATNLNPILRRRMLHIDPTAGAKEDRTGPTFGKYHSILMQWGIPAQVFPDVKEGEMPITWSHLQMWQRGTYYKRTTPPKSSSSEKKRAPLAPSALPPVRLDSMEEVD